MIIGICGFQSCGKDTVAKYLIDKYGFKKLSFACILKDIISIMFDWPRDKLEGITNEDRIWREQIDPWWADVFNIPNLTPRYVMQFIGTDLFRKHFHPDFWVKVFERQLTKYSRVVVTDCRYENEINLLKNHGGLIIQLYRNMPKWFYDYKNKKIKSNEFNNLHISETSWIDCNYDIIIKNNSTIDELYKELDYNLYKLYGDGIKLNKSNTTYDNTWWIYSQDIH
jgi:hypothetical protein